MGAESTTVLRDVCDAGKVDVVAAEEKAVENIGVAVPAVREEWSQWRITPLEPPETRVKSTECYAMAFGLWATCYGASDLGDMRRKRSQNLMRSTLLPDRRRPIQMPFNTFHILFMASKDTFPIALCKGPYAYVWSHHLQWQSGHHWAKKLSPCMASQCAGHTVRLFMLQWAQKPLQCLTVLD
jgi:hypothetical protein